MSHPFPTRRSANKRRERLAAARAKGCHTKAEWTALADVFGCCVACGVSYSDLNGGRPTKDHIEPIWIGGCDCIANLQPMCRNCNSGKPSIDDYRNQRRPGWVKFYLARMGNGWAA